MKRMMMLALTAFGGAVLATTAPQPYIHYAMDAIVGGKVLNTGTNTAATCDLTVSPYLSVTNINGLTGLYFPPSSNAWACGRTPGIVNRTLSFWICREPDDSGFKPGDADEVQASGGYKAQYLLAGWSRNNYMTGGNTTYFTSKFGRYESTKEEIARSYFYYFANVPRGEWHHVAFVYALTGYTAAEAGGEPIYDARAYVDGLLYKEVADHVGEPEIAQESTFILGNLEIYGNRPLNMTLRDVRMYDCAVPWNVIYDQFQEGLRQLPHALLARYTMETVDGEGNSRTTPDVAGSSSALSLGNADGVTPDVAGVEGKGLYFTGDSEQSWGLAAIKTGGPELYDFTVSMWLKVPRDLLAQRDVAEKKMGRFWDFGNTRLMFNANDQYDANNVNGDFYLFADRRCPLPYLYAEKGVWSHVAVSTELRTRLRDDYTSWCYLTNESRCVVYVNGRAVFTNDWACVTRATNTSSRCSLSDGKGFVLANNSTTATNALTGRPLAFTADDLRVYRGALSADEVRAIYGGVALPSAGADFTVASSVAELHGAVDTAATNVYGRVRQVGTLAWSLVSAPAGGEGAAFAAAESPVTRVTLPVAGTYVFRLSCSAACVTEEDDVTVTRIASPAGNVPPAVSIATPAAVPPCAPCALAATVTDSDAAPGTLRGRWRFIAGPGGVWFKDPFAAQTTADFSAAGTYTLRYEASDGLDTSSADVTVEVSGTEAFDAATSLTNGLIGYWSLAMTNAVSNQSVLYDGITGTVATRDLEHTTLDAGIDGNGFRARGKTSSLLTNCTLREDGTDGCRPVLPEGQETVYRSFSFWMYHDTVSPNTNELKCVALVAVPYALELNYNCENGVEGNMKLFHMWQQNGKDSNGGVAPAGGGGNMYFSCPAVSPANRWMHVYVAFDRYRQSTAGNNSQFWIDGVRQTPYYGTMGYSRVKKNIITFGGMNGGSEYVNDQYHSYNGYFTNSVGETLSRTLPGWMDEIRMYDRLLDESEIKYLATHPVVGANRGPSVSALAAKDTQQVVARKRALSFAPTVQGDVVPYDLTLTYAWACIGGEAANVTFADAASRTTSATFAKAGSYVIRLTASDGTRSTCSDPLIVDVTEPGMVILLK